MNKRGAVTKSFCLASDTDLFEPAFSLALMRCASREFIYNQVPRSIYYCYYLFQARPMFNNRKKLPDLVDPRLEGRYPMRGLYQALAVASMCIQEEAAARPQIADVMTALSYLTSHAFDPNASSAQSIREKEERRTSNSNGSSNRPAERGGSIGRNGEGGSGSKLDLDGSGREDSPKETVRMLNRDLDRERAVAEAKLWGENWREKKQANG